MNFTKLLRIMPFILAGLIVILVCLIIIGGLEDQKGGSSSSSDKGTSSSKEEKEANSSGTGKSQSTNDDEKKPVDWEEDNKNSDSQGKKDEDEGTSKKDDKGDNKDQKDDPDDGKENETGTEDGKPDDSKITDIVTPTPEPEDTGNEYGLVFEDKEDFVEMKPGSNVRVGASDQATVVTTLNETVRLERTGYNAYWTRVVYNGQECYIATRLITGVFASGKADAGKDVSGFEPKNDYVEVKAGSNIRQEPSTEASVVVTLESVTRLKRTGSNGDWSKVEYNGKTCYVANIIVTGTFDSPKSDANTEADTDAEKSGEGQETGNENNDKNEKNDPENNDNNDTNDNKENNEKTEGTVKKTDAGGYYFGSGSGKLICIDPGHQTKGNYDTEAVAPGSSERKAKVSSGTSGKASGLSEYELNLTVSLMLKDELVKRGYRVVMTRVENDVNISNIERATIANDNNADAFVRVHANGSDNTSVSGIETICQTSKNKYVGDIYDKCRKLSDTVLDGIVKATGGKKRGVWETDTMSGINWSKVPVTIVEMGFMTNSEEDKQLADDNYQKKIVKGIADGIDAFFAN